MELHCPQCQHVLDQDNGMRVAHPAGKLLK